MTSLTPYTGNTVDRLFKDLKSLSNFNFWDSMPRDFITNQKGTTLKITGDLPKIDIIERNDEIKVIFNLHGYDKDKLKLTVNEQEHKLTLNTGKLTPYDEDIGEDHYVINEIKQSTCQREIVFPDQLDLTSIKSKYKDGYLVCTIPYGNVVKENDREIKIK